MELKDMCFRVIISLFKSVKLLWNSVYKIITQRTTEKTQRATEKIFNGTPDNAFRKTSV